MEDLNLLNIVYSYDPYSYIRDKYKEIGKEIRGFQNDRVLEDYNGDGNYIKALLSDIEIAINVFSDCLLAIATLEGEEKAFEVRMLEVLKQNRRNSDNIIKVARVNINDFSVLEENKDEDDPPFLYGPERVTPEMARQAFSIWGNNDYMDDYILKSRDMELYREYINSNGEAYHIYDIAHVHPDDLIEFFDIIKHTSPSDHVKSLFLNNLRFPEEYIIPIMKYFKQPIDNVKASSDIIEWLIENKMLEKGSQVLIMDEPSKTLLKKLERIDAQVETLEERRRRNE